MTTATERLAVVYDSYKCVYAHRAQDLKEAATDEDVDRILANVDSLEGCYLAAAKQALDASGGEVEEAFAGARAAHGLVVKAYEDAIALAEKIRLVSSSARAVASLLAKAGRKG